MGVPSSSKQSKEGSGRRSWNHYPHPPHQPSKHARHGRHHHASSRTQSRSSRTSDKRKMGSCTKFLKYGTGVFTTIIFLAGIGILSLGIYILGSEYGARELSKILGNDLYQVSAYVLITTGSLLFLISLCGCCGAYRESKCLLGIFILLMSILVVALIVAAILVFVFREKMSTDVIHSMEDILIYKYGVDLNDHPDNRMITDFWNFMQRELKCCGVTGNVNSSTSWAIYKLASEWHKGHDSDVPYVPESCCKDSTDTNRCTGITDFAGPPKLGPPLGVNIANNPDIYTQGCYDELVHYILDHAVVIGICSIVAVVLMICGLIFSVCLCRRIDTLNYY